MAGEAACKLLVGNADGTEVKPLQQVMVSKVIDDILVSHAMATHRRRARSPEWECWGATPTAETGVAAAQRALLGRAWEFKSFDDRSPYTYPQVFLLFHPLRKMHQPTPL